MRAIRHAGLRYGGETLMTECPIDDESHPVLVPPNHAFPVTPNSPSRQGFRTFLIVFDLGV